MPRISISGLHLDKSTNKLISVDYDHHEVHDGKMFSCHYVQDVSDTNDRSIIAFKTPNTTTGLHMIMHVAATAAADFLFYEAPTIAAAAGTNLTVYNHNRRSTNTATILSTKDATVNKATYFSESDMGEVTGGTELYHEHIGAGRQGQAVSGSSRGVNEWILAKNTIYSIELISLDANNNTHHLELIWYEHVDKKGGV